MSMTIRKLTEPEICRDLFRHFERRQVVQQCLRRRAGAWRVEDAPFIDQWSEEDYAFLVQCLQNTIHTGGAVFGAFIQNQLKGFVSVEATPFGRQGDYRDLTSLHVSQELRGRGVGRRLFQSAADWAREQGATKLYISSHSAVETQAFYQAMGCVDAAEINAEHAEREPFDRQLEYPLS